MCLSVKWRESVFYFSIHASVHKEINKHQHESGSAQYPGEEIFIHVYSLKCEVNVVTGRPHVNLSAGLSAISQRHSVVIQCLHRSGHGVPRPSDASPITCRNASLGDGNDHPTVSSKAFSRLASHLVLQDNGRASYTSCSAALLRSNHRIIICRLQADQLLRSAS